MSYIYNKKYIMKKVIRLTESDLSRIVTRVISEQNQSFTTGFKQGKSAGKQTQQAVKGAVKQAGQFVKGATEQTIKIAGQTIKGVFVGGVVVFILAGKAIKVGLDIGKKIFSFLGSLGKQFGSIVVGGAKSVANFAQATLTKASSNVADLFTTIFNMIKKLGSKAYAAALSMASKISDIWKNISSWATGALKSAYSSVKKVAGDVTKKVSDVAGSAYNQASKVAGNVGGYVSGLFSEGIIDMMLEDYHYYNSLPIKKMINEIYLDNRHIL